MVFFRSYILCILSIPVNKAGRRGAQRQRCQVSGENDDRFKFQIQDSKIHDQPTLTRS
jgi:hypothetical protein